LLGVAEGVVASE
jgi:hypothetical protein